jgi:predicted dehydrogenase
VSIALPPDVQATLALDAARAGKHLLLEKPVARSPAASQAIASEAARRDLCTVVFFMRRFVPDIERAVQEAAAGAWNRASVRVQSSALADGSPYAGSVWRREPHGALWDIGPHVLSILIPVLGDVREVAPEAAEEPGLAFVTSHERGAQASVSLTLHAPRDATSNDYRFESSSSTLVLPDPPLDRPGHYSAAAGELVANIASRSTGHRCDVSFGARIVRVLEAIERSRSTGERVTLAH